MYILDLKCFSYNKIMLLYKHFDAITLQMFLYIQIVILKSILKKEILLSSYTRLLNTYSALDNLA